MTKVNRNAPCPCGSGLKYKKCCGAKSTSKVDGLKPGIRMKGGVGYSTSRNAYVAIVHTWDNVECLGDYQEWESHDVFPTEDTAMEYYKAYIRPSLSKMMSSAEQRKLGVTTTHVKLE